MSGFAQHIVIALVVVAAVAYLGRVLWKTFAAKTGCGCAGKSCARMDEMNRRLETAGKGTRLDVRTGKPVSPQN